MIFGKNNYFCFLIIISQELIIASGFIINNSVKKIFQHHFQWKKVCTILNKIWCLCHIIQGGTGEQGGNPSQNRRRLRIKSLM
jgi:hypothetical protein